MSDDRQPSALAKFAVGRLTGVAQAIRHMHFFDLTQLSSFAGQDTIIAVLTMQPLDPNRFVIQSSLFKPLCSIHYVYSGSLHCGYLIEPRVDCVVNTLSNMVSVVAQKDKPIYTNARITFQDRFLTLFQSDEGAALVCFHTQFRFLSPEILKGGSGV